MQRPDVLPAVACAVLVLGLGLQLALPRGDPSPQDSPVAPRRPTPVAVWALPEYPAILASPAFAPDRRPGAAELAAAGGGALSGYAAVGAAAGGGAAAGVISGPGGQIRTVRPGEVVDGWRLVGVSRARLVFERDGARHSLAVGAPAEVLLQAAGNAPDAANGASRR